MSDYIRRSYTLSPEIVERIEKIADREDRSTSATVRQALRAYIDQKEKEYADLKQEDLF